MQKIYFEKNEPELQNIWPFWSGLRPGGCRERESEKLDLRDRVAIPSKRSSRSAHP